MLIWSKPVDPRNQFCTSNTHHPGSTWTGFAFSLSLIVIPCHRGDGESGGTREWFEK